MSALPIAQQIAESAVDQVRRAIALLKAMRDAEPRDADKINGIISEVHRQVKDITLPSPELRAHVRRLATFLTSEMSRIKLLEKVQRGVVGLGKLPPSLAPLERLLDQWIVSDVWRTGLADDIRLALGETDSDYVDHIAQVNDIKPGHSEYGYQLNTARVERLLALMGEVRGLCAVYGSELEARSPYRSIGENKKDAIDNTAVTSPLEQQFAVLNVKNEPEPGVNPPGSTSSP